MKLNRKFIIVGLMVCFAGTWLILRPATADTTGSGAAATTDEATAGSPDGSGDGSGTPQSGTLRSEPVDPDGPDGTDGSVSDGDGEADPSEPGPPDAGRPTGAELASLTPQTIPGPAPVPTGLEVDTDCDTAYAGLGVEFRAWGDVLLPYTPGYPTNEPGEVWDCTADTVFGGAIAMTHAAYLEALRPELIPTIAADTPGRAARMDGHGARTENEEASLGFLCAPIGWNWDGADTWSLLHQCGEGEAQVSYYRMEHRNDRWWLVYSDSGEVQTGPPPDGYEYYPFIGGE